MTELTLTIGAPALRLVEREDLSQRPSSILSKSALTTFDMCGHKAWHEIHHRRPMPIIEKVVFGSALDAAIEQVGKALRDGNEPDLGMALDAAAEVGLRDGLDVDLTEVGAAVKTFTRDVAPQFDWSEAAFQVSLRAQHDLLGDIAGHPDIVFPGQVVDVKSSARSKPQDAAATATELGWYALLVEAVTGDPVEQVGYVTWVRSSKPGWQVLTAPVTHELRRRTLEVALAFVRARNADRILNARAETPENWTMVGGPKGASLCTDCAYKDICPIAYRTAA